MSNDRLLLVEDDPLMIRFVELAARGRAVELIVCDGVATARRRLAQDSVGLVMTDLNLADGSGLDLLAELPDLARQCRSQLPPPRTVVCSGSITPEVQARAEALGAWRILQKPVAVAVLARAIAEGMEAAADPSRHAGPASIGPANMADAPAQALAHAGTPEQTTALDDYFGGDTALFAAYGASFMRQLPATLAAADAAWLRQDLSALGRSAHNLKTVLRTLGDPASAQLALLVEQAGNIGELAAMQLHWAALRELLRQKIL